jgi:hypothetical protein
VTRFGCVEDVEESEDFIVFEVLAVCEELDVFFDGVCKGKLTCFKCGEEDHEGFDCTNDIMCCNCGQPQMVFSKDCHFFKTEKEIQKAVREKYNVP